MIRIYKYKNVKLPTVFYCYDKNEFYTKENLNYQNSKNLKWKKIHRQYKIRIMKIRIKLIIT
jgi:hypothetical protein